MDFQRGAVVADDENQCVLIQTALVQRGHDSANAVIDGRQHRQRLATSLGHVTGKSIQVVPRRIQGHMRGTIRQIQKERIILETLDEGDRERRNQVQVVAASLLNFGRNVIAVQVHVPMPRRVTVLCKDFVKPVLRDRIRFARTEVPFAGHAGGVARFL